MRITFAGFHQQGTGVGGVLHELGRRIAAQHNIQVLELGQADRPEWASQYCARRMVAPNDLFGAQLLAEIVTEYHSQAVLLYCEAWHAHHYINSLQRLKGEVRIVVCCPVDGEFIPSDELDVLSHADAVVVFTEGCRDSLVRNLGDESIDRLNAVVIPHGTDPFWLHDSGPGGVENLLFGYSADARLKEGDFVVLNPNRNTARKNLHTTLEAFALFSQGKSERVKLCLHGSIQRGGYNPVGHARDLGLIDRVVFTSDPRLSQVHCWTRNDLRALYSLCSVGINTSGGEAWGLTHFEHAATGAALVLPRHTACAELWKDAALLIEPSSDAVVLAGSLLTYPPSAESASRGLNMLYEQPDLLFEVQNNCKSVAESSPDWDFVANEFSRVLTGSVLGPAERKKSI